MCANPQGLPSLKNTAPINDEIQQLCKLGLSEISYDADVTFMFTLAKDLNGITVPFPNEWSLDFMYFSTLLFFTGFLLNTLLLLANRGRRTTANTLMILSLCISDALFCLFGVIVDIGILLHQGYFWGETFCYVNAFVYFTCCSVSVFTVMGIAMERYLTSCRGIKFTDKTIGLWIAINWASIMALSFILVCNNNAGTIIVLEEKIWYCFPDWTSKASPLYQVMCFLVVFLFLISFTIAFAYHRVYQKVKKATQESNRKGKLEMERVIFVRCLSVSSAFLISWCPEFAVILLEFVTSRSVPFSVSLATSMLVVAHTNVNPILIMFLDNVMKKRVSDYLSRHSAVEPNIADTLTLKVETQRSVTQVERCIADS